MIGTINEVPELAPIAPLVPQLADCSYGWERCGEADGQFVLIEPGREECYYSFHDTREAALKSLAASVGEGSFDFYESNAYVVDIAASSATVVRGISVDGLET